MDNNQYIIVIDLIESIKVNDLEKTKLNINLFNNSYNFKDNFGIYEILPVQTFAYTLDNGYNNESLYYMLDNINGLSVEDAEEIKWNLLINYLSNKPEEIKEFILEILKNNEWKKYPYKIYSLIRLASANQDYDSLILIKENLNN